MKQGILIAFGELFLKSEQVKKLFIKRLINHILFLSKKEIDFKLIILRDRLFLQTNDILKAKKIIKKVPGISWYSEGYLFDGFDLKEITQFILRNHKITKTFAIRVNKKKDVKESKELIIKKIAELIDKKVDLKKPNKEINIEIQKTGTFVFYNKIKGLGGLPMNSSGKALVLMSGGIDSPVASYLLSLRGIEPVWLHFHSFPLVSKKSIEKTKELASVFLNYHSKLKIYFIPFSQAQMKIKGKTPANYRILLYRRLMLKIAEKIAEKENCLALVTGESLGQVSSQTLDNLNITERSIKIPVLRPLIEKDKQDIINLAQKIKTLEISQKPQEDCCTLFVPKKATAKGDLKKVEQLEKEINVKKIEKDLLKNLKPVIYPLNRV